MDQEDKINIEANEEELGDQAVLRDKFTKLKTGLKVCEEERRDYLEGWQRERADFANWKRENMERRDEERNILIGDIVRDFIPVLEGMEKARAWSPDLAFIETQMEHVLANYGLEKFGKAGEPFDPKMHEAIAELPAEDESKNHTVGEIVSVGYKLGGRVLKVSKVKVAIYKTNNNKD